MSVRRSLAGLYSQNLLNFLKWVNSRVTPNKQQLWLKSIAEQGDIAFLCPLCYGLFAAQNPNADLSKRGLTIEHVPPKSVGHHIRTLTCRSCNSETGKYEGKVQKSMEKSHKWREEGKATGRVFFNGSRGGIGVKTEFGEDPTSFSVIKKQSDDNDIDQLKSLIRQETLKFNLKLRIARVDEQRKLSVLYKSAYLILFYTFGYSYALVSTANLVREQILNPEKKLLSQKSILSIADIPGDLDPPSVTWTTKPVKSISVILPWRIREEKIFYQVLFPRPGFDASAFYNNVENVIHGNKVDQTLSGYYNVPSKRSLDLVEKYGIGHLYNLCSYHLD